MKRTHIAIAGDITITCLRCGRVLTSADSIAAGYGPTCRAKIRAAEKAADLTEFSPRQVGDARELIHDGGALPLRRWGHGSLIIVAVSTDGTAVHRTTTHACTCPAGVKGTRCYHLAAARILTAANFTTAA